MDIELLGIWIKHVALYTLPTLVEKSTSIMPHGMEDDHLWDGDPGQVNPVIDFDDKISGKKW